MMDLARIKRNVAKMAAQNAPEADIDGYIASEGATVDAVRAFKLPKPGSKDYANWALQEALAGRKPPQVGPAPVEYRAPQHTGPMDQVMAGYTSAVNAIPIAGPSIMGKLNEAKGALQGRDPAEIASENQTIEQANPIASGAGMVAGTVLPFMGAGAIPGVGRALGMTGGLGSRVAFGTVSGGGIGAVDTLARGGDAKDAMVSGGIGAALGGALPVAARGLQKLVTPLAANRGVTQAARTLQREGVDLTAGQRTGSKKMRYIESELGGGAADDFAERQGRQFTAAAFRRAGIAADSAEPQVVDQAFDQIGQRFDDLSARNTLVADRQFTTQLGQALRDYQQNVPPSQQAAVVQNTIGDLVAHLTNNGNRMSGEYYKALRSRLDRLARGTTDPELKMTLRDMVGALDQGMERSIGRTNPNDLGAFREVRRNYANMLVIEKAATGAGEQAASGVITPARLRSAAIAQNRRAFARGRNDFVDLANAGVQAMTPLPQSGTAPRLAARIPLPLGAATGAGIGGTLGGLPGAAIGGAIGAAVPWAAGRTALSRPGARLLANQVFADMPRGLIAPAVPQLLADQR